MNEIRYLKAYLIYTVCATLAGFAAGAFQGFLLGVALALAGVPTQRISLITGITGFFAGALVGFFVFRWSIRTFVLPQLARQRAAPDATPPPLPCALHGSGDIDESLTINNPPSD